MTEIIQWQLIQGTTPKRPIENDINFPKRTSILIKDELITMVEKHTRRKADYTKRRVEEKRKYIDYEAGRLILIRSHKLSREIESRKLLHLYKGPYRITKLIGTNTLAVTDTETGKANIVNDAIAHLYHSSQ